MADGGRHQVHRAGVHQIAHHLVGDAPLLLGSVARQPRKLRDGAAQALHQFLAGSHRFEVGFWEVAVVLGGLLVAAR